MKMPRMNDQSPHRTTVAGKTAAWLGVCLWASLTAGAATTAPATTAPAGPKPAIVVSAGLDEDKKPALKADITLDGKPLKNAHVHFYIKRTFGNLSSWQDASSNTVKGTDETDETGHAEVAFPANLPGDTDGMLQVIVRIIDPEKYGGIEGQAKVSGALPLVVEKEPAFPRALWAPHAPRWLIGSIVILLGGVWGAFVFTVYQVIRIHKGE